MLRTIVARQVRDELHGAEASLETALTDARATLERLIAAKTELGLTGTMGDAAIARMRDSVATLEQAQELMVESHRESYTVLKPPTSAAWRTADVRAGQGNRSPAA
jgi:hypothetical protein